MTSSLHTIKLKLNAYSVPRSELIEWASPYIFPVHCLSKWWYTEVCRNMPTGWRQMHAPCWLLDLQWSKWQNCSRVSLVLLVYWFLPFRDLLNLLINSTPNLVPRPFLYGWGEKGEGRKGSLAFLAPPIQEGSGNQTTLHLVTNYRRRVHACDYSFVVLI